jgi:hypothetical protein
MKPQKPVTNAEAGLLQPMRKICAMQLTRLVAILVTALTWSASSLPAQTLARDPSARLREVLPADVAERVLARIAEARARELPAAALEQRALKFAAKGVTPALIEKSVAEHAERMSNARDALERALQRRASADELEAGAEALRKGVPGSALSELARAAPSGRSLAMPLYALSGLLDRGLPADEAIRRVHDRLAARAADSDFQRMSTELPPRGQGNRPELTGPDLAATKRPAQGQAGKAPVTVPGNAGKNTRPTPTRPTTPPGRGRGRGL